MYNIESVQLIPTVPTGVLATGVLTSDNTNVSDGETVAIGSTVYTFKTKIAKAYDVVIGASADASLTSLANAINGKGTLGVDYFADTIVNKQVTSSAVAAHALTLTAINSGYASNAIATTETSAHLSFGATTLTGGIGGKLINAILNGTGTTNTDAINVGGYHELIAFINVLTESGTNPTLDIKMQFSPDYDPMNGLVGTWIDSADAFTQITTSTGVTFKRATANFGKYVRYVFTLGGTTPNYKFNFTVCAKN